MILRSHSETGLSAVFQYLVNSHKLSTLREDLLAESDPIAVSNMTDVCEAETKHQQSAYEFGFILPTHGKLRLWAEETLMRYEYYQSMYDEVYGKNAWGGAEKFKEPLEMCRTTELTNILGSRVGQHEIFLDSVSPVPPLLGSATAASAVFSEGATVSSPLTEHSPSAVLTLEFALAAMASGMEEE